MVLGIAGGSGSGKTTFARLIRDVLGVDRCCLVQQDSYYHDQSQRFDRDGGSVNFDHPDAIDFGLLVDQIAALKTGRSVRVPVYDYESHRRLERSDLLLSRPVVLVEGMLILASEPVREHIDLKVFIDAPEHVRLARRLLRDTRERGRDPAGVERQFQEHVKPMHDRFVEPSRSFADHVFSGEGAMGACVRQLLEGIGLDAPGSAAG
jgi:uridine kinase